MGRRSVSYSYLDSVACMTHDVSQRCQHLVYGTPRSPCSDIVGQSNVVVEVYLQYFDYAYIQHMSYWAFVVLFVPSAKRCA